MSEDYLSKTTTAHRQQLEESLKYTPTDAATRFEWQGCGHWIRTRLFVFRCEEPINSVGGETAEPSHCMGAPIVATSTRR